MIELNAENAAALATSAAVQEQRFRRFGPLALGALCLLICFYGLGHLPFIGPDEPRYAEVAREMYLTGDWVTPRLADIHWFEKPALTYWLSALGFTFFGVSEFAARVGITVTATLGVYLLYVFGARVRSARYGYLSASVLLSGALWPGFARAATFDLPLTVCLALALLAFYGWEQSVESGERKDRYWYLFAVALGVALLAKGLVGLVLPAGIIGLYLLLTRRLQWLWQPKLLLIGGLLLVAVASLWYGPMLARHGREFINEFFIAHHFKRYLSNKYNHPQPFYFFFTVILAGCFPWTLWLISGLQRALRDRQALLTEPAERLRLLLWLWVLVPLAFFTVSGSKLPGYILPVFPALALLIALELERVWDDIVIPWAGWGTVVLFLLLAVAILIAGRNQPMLTPAALTALACIAGFVAFIYLALLLMRKFGSAALFLPIGVALLLIFAVRLTFPMVAQRESLREFIFMTKKLAFPGERAIFFINNHHSFDFYAPDMPLRDEKSDLITAMTTDEIERHMQTNNLNSIVIISPQRWTDGLVKTYLPQGRLDFPKGDDHVMICSPGCKWVMMRLWLRKPNF